jgi:hypothetical protein
VRASRSIPATLLLVAVTSGLFAMHTLGHAGAPGTMPGHQATAPMHASHAGPSLPSVDLPAPGGPGLMMGELLVCLAILGGVVLFALTSRRARGGVPRRPAGPGWATWIASAVRGPPSSRIGLALADLSVLRS